MHTLCLRQTIYVVHHYRLGVLARALLRRISFMETMSNCSNGIAPIRLVQASDSVSVCAAMSYLADSAQ